MSRTPVLRQLLNFRFIIEKLLSPRGEPFNAFRFLRFVSYLIFFVFIVPSGLQAESFYCGSRIVSTGKSRWNVEKLCGPPAFIDQRHAEKVIDRYQKIKKKYDDHQPQEHKNKRLSRPQQFGADTHKFQIFDENCFWVSSKRFDINIEEWTYNFGPDRFIRTLIFHNDQLVDILTGEYGFDEEKIQSIIAVHIGDSKPLVFLKYAEPTYKDIHTKEETTVHYEQDNDFIFVEKYTAFVDIEEWTYDSDPDRLPQRLLFKNSRLVDIEHYATSQRENRLWR